jgi:hypothetical protein
MCWRREGEWRGRRRRKVEDEVSASQFGACHRRYRLRGRLGDPSGFFMFFLTDDTVVVRLGWAVTVALVEGAIFAGAFYAFRRVVGLRSRSQDGG